METSICTRFHTIHSSKENYDHQETGRNNDAVFNTSIIKCSGRLWLEATPCAEEGAREVAGEAPPAPKLLCMLSAAAHLV